MQDPVFAFVQHPYAQLTGIVGGIITLGGFLLYIFRSLHSNFVFARDILKTGVKSANFRRNLRYARIARYDSSMPNGVLLRVANFLSVQLFAIGLAIITAVVTFTKLRELEIVARLGSGGVLKPDAAAVDGPSIFIFALSVTAGFGSIIAIWLSSERMALYTMWIRRRYRSRRLKRAATA